jgi:ferric-dicitrate binding protein FerR (iron transport regulator)
MSISDGVLNAANTWFAKLVAAERIEDESLEFETWVQADPIHNLAFRAIKDARFEVAYVGLIKGPPTD